MKKWFLLIFSIIFVLIGFLAIIKVPIFTGVWFPWAEIIIGIIGLFIAFAKDK